MRIPDPIANTTTEAYLAYKAGVPSEGDLKPKLYDPYIHLDAWLAYWAGLTNTYPVKGVGKNLFNGNTIDAWLQPNGTPTSSTKDRTSVDYIPVTPNTSYVLHGTNSTYLKFTQFDSSKTAVSQQTTTSETSLTATTGPTTAYVRIGWGNADKGATDVILERGSEATAYEPYTGEPEMLTDEEALIAYLSGVTNTYPEEFRDPADVRVAAYLKYLVSARWGRPEYPVTNEELYLSMMDAPYIPAGEPSSDIEIDDTAEAPFKDVKMYGNTSQQTYSGKNKFPCVMATQYPSSSELKVETDAESGTITFTALDTSGSQLGYFNTGELDASSSYTISMQAKKISGTASDVKGRFYVRYRTSSDGSTWTGYTDLVQYAPASIGTYYQISGTVTGSKYYQFLFYNYASNPAPVGEKTEYKNIQLVAGSTADYNFEPYVGGTASPNPDYPQAVQTVTGENVVKINGKNLFDSSKIIVGDIQNANTTIRLHSSQILWLEAGTYTFSTNLPTPLRYSISATDKGYPPYATWPTWDYNSSWQDSERKTTFTLTKGGYFNAQFSKLNNATLTLDEFAGYNYQLELGSSASSFEPYQEQSYPISLGSIELCKIGDYQDYIYENDGKWYVHKTINTGTRDVTINGIAENNNSGPTIAASAGAFHIGAWDWAYYGSTIALARLSSNMGVYKLDESLNGNAAAREMEDGTFCQRQGTNDRLYFRNTAYIGKTGDELKSILLQKSGGANFWWIIGTPTDTEITNTALIDQLNALKNGGSYTGTTYIKVSATDPNLPGLLKVEAYKYD